MASPKRANAFAGFCSTIAFNASSLLSDMLCYHTSDMCCPYFDPVAPQASRSGSAHSTLPLGDAFTGLCRASSDQPIQPDQDVLHALCNLGYARGACDRFPSGDGPDAVRFTVSRDDGASIGLYYVLERDHLPYAHGPLASSATYSGFAEKPEGVFTERQALAYLASYRRRKAEIAAT